VPKFGFFVFFFFFFFFFFSETRAHCFFPLTSFF